MQTIHASFLLQFDKHLDSHYPDLPAFWQHYFVHKLGETVYEGIKSTQVIIRRMNPAETETLLYGYEILLKTAQTLTESVNRTIEYEPIGRTSFRVSFSFGFYDDFPVEAKKHPDYQEFFNRYLLEEMIGDSKADYTFISNALKSDLPEQSVTRGQAELIRIQHMQELLAQMKDTVKLELLTLH